MKFVFSLIVVLLFTACAQKAVKPVLIAMSVPTFSYEEAPVAECLSLLAVGDMMFGGTATPTLNEFGYDYPFEKTASLLGGADIAVGNLETALTYRGEPFEKKYTFRNPPEKVAAALTKVGFDLVSLANNHSMDYGIEGLEDTLSALQAVGLPAVGAGMNEAEARLPKIIENKNQKIGFLAYSLTFPEEFWAKKDRPGTAFAHANHVKADVGALKEEVDHVVVQFHWGREGTTELRDYQVALGRASIDAGASLVLGHHPHILQAIEQYKGGVIYYSLGNFAFGSFSNRVQAGGVASVELCPEGVSRYALKLVDVNNFRVRFRPETILGDKLGSVYKELKSISALRGTSLELVGGEIVVGSARRHVLTSGIGGGNE
jgi:poly-gamma-glutamate synthesis protein (capsule biosynthesis protein)